MSDATFRIAYLEIGRLRRRELLRTLATARMHGCDVSYNEDRGFLDSLFTDLKVSGPERPVISTARQIVAGLDNVKDAL